MIEIQSRVIEALQNIISNSSSLTISDVLDENDNIIGKFYLSYSDKGYPYIISMEDDTLRVLDVYRMRIIVMMCKVDNIYKFPLNNVNIPRTLLIDLFRKVSELI